MQKTNNNEWQESKTEKYCSISSTSSTCSQRYRLYCTQLDKFQQLFSNFPPKRLHFNFGPPKLHPPDGHQGDLKDYQDSLWATSAIKMQIISFWREGKAPDRRCEIYGTALATKARILSTKSKSGREAKKVQNKKQPDGFGCLCVRVIKVHQTILKICKSGRFACVGRRTKISA